MKTRSTIFTLLTLAAVSVASAQQDRRPERLAPTRDRGSYNYVTRHPQMETDYRSENRSSHANVHGYVPHQDRSWGSHWRYGYSSDHRFDSRSYAFGAYQFTPFGDVSYPSPWYYYPELPPYVPASSVEVVPSYSFSWNQGNAYSYPGGGAGDDPALDNALGALTTAFANHDANAINPLIAPGSSVAIFQDNHYEYSLHGSDFNGMLQDNLTGADTTSFTINDVRHWDEQAIVHATQVVTNPDGGTDSVMLRLHLVKQGGNFIIADMNTNR